MDPYLGEIRYFASNLVPKGWARCNGQLLPINQNQALFALLGTQYGGNGQTTFALPNLQGQVPAHYYGWVGGPGVTTGADAVTVTTAQLPAHTHAVSANAAGATTNVPGSSTRLASSTPQNAYTPPSNLTAMHPASVTNTGGSQPHENRMPYLTMSACIALQGVFPSQN